MRIATPTRRPGATAVEMAIVLPVCFLLLMGIFQGGILIFNAQQIVWLSREASRRASVRGSDYAKETSKLSLTEADIRRDVVLPLAITLDPAQLTVEVFLIDGNTQAVTPWDASDKAVYAILGNGTKVTNRVRVRVSYVWGPTYVTAGSIRLQSTTEVPMAF